eukprot:gene17881-21327_t
MKPVEKEIEQLDNYIKDRVELIASFKRLSETTNGAYEVSEVSELLSMITGDQDKDIALVDVDSAKKRYQTMDINYLKNILKRLEIPPIDNTERIESLFEYDPGYMERYKEGLSKVYRSELNTIKVNKMVLPASDLYFIGRGESFKEMEVLSLHSFKFMSAPVMKTRREILDHGAVNTDTAQVYHINGVLYIVGGRNGIVYTDDITAVDINTKIETQPFPNLKTAICCSCSKKITTLSIDTRFPVALGSSLHMTPYCDSTLYYVGHDCLQSYNIEAKKWTPILTGWSNEQHKFNSIVYNHGQ